MAKELAPSFFEKASHFDSDFYSKICPPAQRAVAAGKLRDVEEHYWSLGSSMGLNPNAYFSEKFYRATQRDVAAAIKKDELRSGFEHYLQVGRGEGRRPNGLWTVAESWYLENYPEAEYQVEKDGLANVLEHYFLYSRKEGHCPHEAFDESFYLDRYPAAKADVSSGRFINGYHHFLSLGLEQGSKPHPAYTRDHYLLLNKDLDRLHRDGDLTSAYIHLVTTGLAENRAWVIEREESGTKPAATKLALVRLEEFLFSGATLRFEAVAEPEVSILLVLFNRSELTFVCLQSLQLLEGVEAEIIIVDNDSRDKTSDLLDRIQGARICRNQENQGFTRAVNQAAALARGRHLLLLNNDTELLPRSLRSALNRLESDEEIGAIGGRIIGLDGKLQEAGSIVWSDGTTEGYGRLDDPQSGAYLFPREVDYCSGVFLLTPRSLFEELGGLDLAFTPAYYEEADYCYRLREKGRRVVYDPGSVVIHFETASLRNETELSHMLADNRPVFLERHKNALQRSREPLIENFFPSSNREDYLARVLIVDDLVPLEKFGSGSPRMQEIVKTLLDLGTFVTFFAANPVPVERGEIHCELGDSSRLEIIRHLGRSRFRSFWKDRQDHYDFVVISRPHNLSELRRLGFVPRRQKARVIYDAEAMFSKRRELQLEVLGDKAPREAPMSFEEEIELARSADEIWAVTELEGRLLAGEDQRLSVIGLAIEKHPGRRSFDDRRGLLFVGRLDEESNPNVDALRWYLETIHSRVKALLGTDVPITVIGEPGGAWFPDVDDLHILGRVDRLESFYDSHRIFLAPSRFAVGIPQKITGAAAHGLPVVATSILIEQLGWQAGSEIADGGRNDSERFAAAVAEVYSSPALWNRLRAGSLDRVGRDQSPETFKATLKSALDL